MLPYARPNGRPRDHSGPLLQQQNEILASQAAAKAPADDDAVPAGYYHADGDPANVERLWDGENWTDVTRQTTVRRPPKRR
jgi:hypothetical protein